MPAPRITILSDYQGQFIRLTLERRLHILEHPEMAALDSAIAQTLADPDSVIQSSSDPAVRLYHRYYEATPVGGKYLCVVVKVLPDDAFVITAYLTDSVKKGPALWPADN